MSATDPTSREQASRRRLVAAGLAGAAAALVAGRSASATTAPPTTTPDGGSTVDSTSPAPPTTAAPLRPTPADTELLALVQSVELAARDLYAAALEAGADDDVITTIAHNHSAYADVLSGLLGGPQPRNDTLFESRQAAFETSDIAALTTAAYELESELVATHADVVGRLQGLDGATTIASVLIVESRHCTVLADLGGSGDDLDALLVNDAEPLSAPTEA